MSREVLHPAALHPSPGFSHVAIAKGSSTVYFAGQVALDDGFNVVGKTLHDQTQAAMRNLQVAMVEAHVGWHDIVRRVIYTTQPTEYEIITKAIAAVTGTDEHPAQTIIGVTGLAIDGLLIEIECTAVLD